MVRVRVRAGPALTLTLTSNKPMETRRADRSIQSSMRSHTCQSIQSCLPTPHQSVSHTNRSGQYSQSIQKSQARQSARSRKPSHSSHRRKDRNPCHSSHPNKSSQSSQPSISVHSRKPTHSSRPCPKVFDTAHEGYSMDWIPTMRSTKWPCRLIDLYIGTPIAC